MTLCLAFLLATAAVIASDRPPSELETLDERVRSRLAGGLSVEMGALDEALIRKRTTLLAQSWNERMWSDDGPVDPPPTIDQAINGG